MDGVDFNDRDFFALQQQGDRHWKLSFNLAVAVHILALVTAIFLPDLVDRRPLLDNVVTVDLVSMPEPAAAPAAPPEGEPVQPSRQDPPQTSAPEPEAAEVSIAPEPQVTPEPAAAAQPVSLKPLKRKVRKAKDLRLAEERERERQAKKQLQEDLARKKAEQARRKKEVARRKRAAAEARQAQREAERAAARARQELASVIRATGAGAAGSASGSSSGRKVSSVVLNQYLSSLYDRVHSYWILPEMRKWDSGLETVVVLVIRRDGSVAHMQIERKSKDPFFDQFVLKTLQEASPMPPFPAVMSQASIEVGLRFKPGELAM